MTQPPSDPPPSLNEARRSAGLNHGELWFRYFELGGMATALELEAYVHGALIPSAHDLDLIAVALNERFFEMGADHPMPYSDDGDFRPA